MCTSPELFDYIKNFIKSKKFSMTGSFRNIGHYCIQAACNRVHIEEIRGVNSDHIINKLIEYNGLELEEWMPLGNPYYLGQQGFFGYFGFKE